MALFIYLFLQEFTYQLSPRFQTIRKHESFRAVKNLKAFQEGIIKCLGTTTMSKKKECFDLFRMEEHSDFQEFPQVDVSTSWPFEIAEHKQSLYRNHDWIS